MKGTFWGHETSNGSPKAGAWTGLPCGDIISSSPPSLASTHLQSKIANNCRQDLASLVWTYLHHNCMIRMWCCVGAEEMSLPKGSFAWLVSKGAPDTKAVFPHFNRMRITALHISVREKGPVKEAITVTGSVCIVR